jgi:hypothetical protein
MAPDQAYEFLRRRYISSAAVAVLLRHGAANAQPARFRRSSAVDLQLWKAVCPGQGFDRQPTGLLGQAFVASIDAAAHDLVLD